MEDTESCALSKDLFILIPERFPTFSVLSFQNGDMYRQINIHYDIAIRRRCQLAPSHIRTPTQTDVIEDTVVCPS